MRSRLELITRSEYEEWLARIPAGSCPLCEWRTYQFVLHEAKHWIWIACRAPYWKYHTMLVPKRHFREMSDVSIVEMGELVETYALVVTKLRSLRLAIDGRPISKFLLFWRLRDEPAGDPRVPARLVHFHLHVTPDRDGLLDPVLEREACDWDPSQLVIAAGAPGS